HGDRDHSLDSRSFQRRAEQYKAAAQYFNIEPGLVLEPANGTDVTTAETFTGSDVLYAEIREKAAEAVKDDGHDVVLADANELYLSTNPDLVVFQNPYVREDEVLENNPAEYVMANNYLGSAETVAGTEEYDLLGAVPQNGTEVEPVESAEKTSSNVDDLFIFRRK
ncbi:MAG: hypothetical protein ABEJ72_01645, partial [Candidatus Aenigmatarchaeota archaeon]